jgi:hypothetical protein
MAAIVTAQSKVREKLFVGEKNQKNIIIKQNDS